VEDNLFFYEGAAMNVIIKKIDAISAMKVGALLSALTFTIFGLFIFLLQSAVLNAVSTAISTSSSPGQQLPNLSGGIFVAGLAGFCFFYIFGVIFSAIFGGIYGLVLAFLYNVISNWVGGLRVTLSREQGTNDEKAKRSSGLEVSDAL
jgi:hypothetical protein